MNRGVGREAIFSTSGDKRFYRNLAKGIFKEYPVDILAYCIMGNHFHFVIKGDLLEFSRALHRTNLSYAMTYNSRRDRVGHVFQNRFKSEMIDSPEYLSAALRYVHNNPVKGNVVKEAAEYEWSSYREYFAPNVETEKCLTSEKGRMEILEKFDNSPWVFEKFHKGREFHLFLDVNEDFKERKVEVAMNIIENEFPKVDFENMEEITADFYLIRRVVMALLNKTTLTHQEISDILGISKYQVTRIAKRTKEERKKYLN